MQAMIDDHNTMTLREDSMVPDRSIWGRPWFHKSSMNSLKKVPALLGYQRNFVFFERTGY